MGLASGLEAQRLTVLFNRNNHPQNRNVKSSFSSNEPRRCGVCCAWHRIVMERFVSPDAATQQLHNLFLEKIGIPLETWLSGEFCTPKRLTGIHYPQCRMAIVNDLSPLVRERSCIRYPAKNLYCRSTAFPSRQQQH
ncbi:hypothetical protein EGR_10057 [Echinococcus granulosus]|uniref:Uncharacterized protein n=1 Tax=Echinococcus granulosus TaxID=6210 RepID=W6U1V9_ECHGR|nr:hypothetical protein EGR_10057 [Echinococcus granulosus]EUB55090.1 hypothetical protein EGR_10057 [Echinococcus granulosus]